MIRKYFTGRGELAPEDSSLIVRLLIHLLHSPTRRGETEVERVLRWLEESELGSGFMAHLAGEAELLDMAANRLNSSGDEELREIAHELEAVAHRLLVLIGLSA